MSTLRELRHRADVRRVHHYKKQGHYGCAGFTQRELCEFLNMSVGAVNAALREKPTEQQATMPANEYLPSKACEHAAARHGHNGSKEFSTIWAKFVHARGASVTPPLEHERAFIDWLKQR